MAIILAILAGAVVSACGKVGTVPTFSKAPGGAAAAASSVIKVTQPFPYVIDAGTGYWDSNNDLSSTCTLAWNGGLTNGRGCMQPPAITYNDSRWLVGFSQNYLATTDFRYSMMSNMTSNLFNGFFGGLGTGLGVIDQGLGLRADITSSSSRYVRFANFPNGSVIAAFSEELVNTAGTATVRSVFASIYDSSIHGWTPTKKLSTTDMPTDTSTDLGAGGLGATTIAQFCRPAVATSGDGSAMVTWCEQSATGPGNIMYATYKSGAWSASKPLITTVGTKTFQVPAYAGVDNRLGMPGPATLNNNLQLSVVAGDIFKTGLVSTVDTATTTTGYFANVTAVDNFATGPQFNIVRDINNNVLVCETLQNMMNALLGTPASFDLNNNFIPYASVMTTFSLSQLGVSMLLNPSCNDFDPTTWNITTYYNRALKPVFRRLVPGAGADNYLDNRIYDLKKEPSVMNGPGCQLNLSGLITPWCFSAFAGPILGSPIPIGLPSAPFPNGTKTDQEDWARAALVDVAGDGNGNYAMVRSLISPFFQDNDITLTGVTRARMLAGHQFINGVGWVQRTGATVGASEPAISFVSRPPSCFNGANYQACSVRNPKFLMSDTGKGLILFHQNQQLPSSVVSPKIPTRLYYSTFSTGNGFSGVATTLDPDTSCSSVSTRNDVPVCETASYDVTSADISSACQNLSEPAVSSSITNITVNHDVPPIAAAMNHYGKAVVAFHKRVFTGTIVAPACGNVGTYVTMFDPVNGFGSVVQVDTTQAGYGNSMHSSVAINSSGDVAVAWETVVGEAATQTVELWLQVYSGGTWGTPLQINALGTLMNTPKFSMMPSVGINDNREVIVTFTYGPKNGTTKRRQLVQHVRY